MNKKTKGIVCIIFSAFCFAFMNAFVRMAGDLPPIQKSFFRNLVALIFAAIILMRTEEKFRFQKENLGVLLLRSIFGTVGILCNFYAIDHLVLSDASILNKLSPFFAILFSFLFLKERLTLFQAFAVTGAFIGSLFIIKPDFANLTSSIPALAGALGGMGAGIAYTCVRYLGTKGERSALIVFFFSAFSCIVTLPYLIFHFTPMTWKQFIILMLAGLSASGGQFGITAAYSYAPAKEISIYDYTQIIFAAVLGFIFFKQVPDRWSVVGYFIIAGMSVAMFVYNKKREND